MLHAGLETSDCAFKLDECGREVGGLSDMGLNVLLGAYGVSSIRKMNRNGKSFFFQGSADVVQII